MTSLPRLARRLALLTVFGAAASQAAPVDETWMSVLLDGRKIGSMQNSRMVAGDHVTTTQNMRIELDRAGTKLALTQTEVDEETADGKPLKFESRTLASGSESLVRGEIRDGTVEVHRRVAGKEQTRTLEWPKGALLAEGLRLAEARAGFSEGARYSVLAFQAENLEAITIESQVGPTQTIELPEGARLLTRIEQTIHLPDASTKTSAWVDRDQNVAKLIMPLMGYELTMVACSQACAQAPNQSADILTHAIVTAPRALTPDERRHGIVLSVSASDGGEALQFAETDEQRVQAAPGHVELRIAPTAAAADSLQSKPDAADTQPNDWLQSDAPEVVALARKGVGHAISASDKMQHLEDFVRGYIRSKNLSVGYASALEVVHRPEGDCTEHAVLLAALARALGIPAHVVDGVAYVDEYDGKQHVFVPHAWVQAYVGGRWRSYDAALRGFDAGHIALSYGNGDPWRFFAAFNTLGRIRVDHIDPAP